MPPTKGYASAGLACGALPAFPMVWHVCSGGVKGQESEGLGQAAEAGSVYSAYDSKSVYSVLSMAPDRVLRLHHVTV